MFGEGGGCKHARSTYFHKNIKNIFKMTLIRGRTGFVSQLGGLYTLGGGGVYKYHLVAYRFKEINTAAAINQFVTL